MRPTVIILLLTGSLFLISQCRPDASSDTDGNLRFSTDTVTFDTVFTTIGSTTLNFKIYNRGKGPLRIRSISLAGGTNSFFRLNVDGVSAQEVSDVEVPPDDSLFVFVAVTIDPLNENNPLVVKDSVVFNVNGSLSDVKLIAYGQDVHLINGEILCTQEWTGDKPYLIYNSMAVDTGCTLTIDAGTSVYFHNNSSLIVWGRLLVNGTAEKPVLFRNDRLEHFYDVVAGQWGTIYIDPISTGNVINYAVIRNAIAGIQIGYPSDYHVPELTLSNSIIENVSFTGIYAFGASLLCYNTVIADCAGSATALLRGGNYRFLHCTVSNNGVLGASRKEPSVILSNVFYNPEADESGNYVYVRRTGDMERAEFINCILYGNVVHEFQFVHTASNLFSYRFDHCLVKASEDSMDTGDTEHFNALIFNTYPEFVNDSDRYHTDYSLDTLSPAQNAGDPSLLELYPFLGSDRDGNPRNTDGKPDLGAYERNE
jgi:hypothetical protein